MIVGLAILLNSLGIIAVAVMIAWLARRFRQQSDEITELQAIADLIAIRHGEQPFFAERYDLDIVIDPSTLPPPEDS